MLDDVKRGLCVVNMVSEFDILHMIIVISVINVEMIEEQCKFRKCFEKYFLYNTYYFSNAKLLTQCSQHLVTVSYRLKKNGSKIRLI